MTRIYVTDFAKVLIYERLLSAITKGSVCPENTEQLFTLVFDQEPQFEDKYIAKAFLLDYDEQYCKSVAWDYYESTNGNFDLDLDDPCNVANVFFYLAAEQVVNDMKSYQDNLYCDFTEDVSDDIIDELHLELNLLNR